MKAKTETKKRTPRMRAVPPEKLWPNAAEIHKAALIARYGLANAVRIAQLVHEKLIAEARARIADMQKQSSEFQDAVKNGRLNI